MYHRCDKRSFIYVVNLFTLYLFILFATNISVLYFTSCSSLSLTFRKYKHTHTHKGFDENEVVKGYLSVATCSHSRSMSQ